MFRIELESYLPPRNHTFTVGKGKTQIFVREEEAMMEEDYSNPAEQAAERKKSMDMDEVRQAIGAEEELNVKVQERLLHQFLGKRREVETDQKGREVVIRESRRNEAEKKREPCQRGSNQLQTQKEPHIHPLPPPEAHNHPSAQPGPQHVVYTGPPGTTPPRDLDIGSVVQLAPDPSRTGVIRWTGNLPEIQGLIAGVELVSDVLVW